MTQEIRPAPLVPPEVDLRGYEFMPLYGNRLFKSETWVTASPEAKVACLRLWWHAYGHEVPAASLPDNDYLLAEYAGYGIGVKAWKKVKAQVLRGFVLCADGRWHHHFLAELALEGWEQRLQHDETAEAKQTRQQRWRDQCKAISQQLRDRGVKPPRGASLETLNRLLGDALNASPPSTKPSTQASTGDAAEIGKNGTDRNGTELKTLDSDTPSIPKRPPPASTVSAPEGWAGECCKALKDHGGCTALNPAHPDLLALHAQGVSPKDFGHLAAAIKHTHGVKPMAYHLAAMKRQIADAQAPGPFHPDAKRKRTDPDFSKVDYSDTPL